MTKKKKQRPKPKGRPTHTDVYMASLKPLGIFQVAEANQFGVSQPTLSRLASDGKILHIGKGLYLHPDSPINPKERDFAAACAKFGKDAVIGGMTALFYHHLIEQVPQHIWVLVTYHQKTTSPLYRCIRTKTDPNIGIEDHKTFRITNLERTLVEAFRYSTKIGLRTALHAARTAISEKRTSAEKVYKQAQALRLQKFIEKHWEYIIPESLELK